MAVKVAVVALAATLTELGTVKAEGRLLASVTLVAAEVALESVTVQVVDADAAKVVLAHCREEMVIGAAVTLRVAVWVLPFRKAVMVEV